MKYRINAEVEYVAIDNRIYEIEADSKKEAERLFFSDGILISSEEVFCDIMDLRITEITQI